VLSAAAAWAQPTLRLPLQCRLGSDPWRDCTMTIQRAGEHWWLDVGQQRLEFRSDGRGQISLMEPTGVRRVVSPRWAEPQALCWDGVCAKGEFPLD
jgi:hypothetical protein